VRAFVFLLILVNLLFLAWAQGYFGPSSDPDAFRSQQQLLADQIRVVARDEAPAETDKSEKQAKPEERAAAERNGAEVCLQLADLQLADSVRIESLLAEKWPAYKARRTSVEGGAGYWVYIPPLPSKQEVDAKAAELKRLRVPELFVVQESGPNNRAISLGLFSSREAATARLEMLRKLGVKSAKVGERRPASVLIEMRGPETQADALRKALAEALPEGRLLACKKAAAQ
jgi:hypothetical protein